MSNSAQGLRLALIVPRYGVDIGGGAETLARHFAETAVAHGCQTEIWTTCATNHISWENRLPTGTTTLNDVRVRRFPITHWPDEQFHRLHATFSRHFTLPLPEQTAWLAHWVHSAPLYTHVARHSKQFDLVIALPYLSSIVLFAAQAALHNHARLAFFPCLHDEPAAYLAPVRHLLEAAGGVLFLTPEEQLLATHRLGINLPRQLVLGMGITPPPPVAAPAAPEKPYLLTVGRLESGKNLDLLYDYMQRYAAESDTIRLILAGEGPFTPPNHPVFDTRGYVSEPEKQKLLTGALALCHPSRNESFSIVLMESWLAGRPVLVHERCAVTTGHVRRSGGGIPFDTYAQFTRAVDWLLAHPQEAAQMGEQGRTYVSHHYNWSSIWQCFIDWFRDQFSNGVPAGKPTRLHDTNNDS